MRTTRKIWAVAAGVSGLAMMVTACSSNGGATSPTTASGGQSAAATTAAASSVCPDGTPTVTVSTFNNFGYQPSTATAPGADLWAKYKEVCPNVTVKETVAASSDDARAAFNTAISTGTGAYDIQAVDVDWMPSIMVQPNNFVDLTPYKTASNDWLGWKNTIATTSDGKLLGFGTDIGPEAICYRSDLLAAAGMPSDRAGVASLLGGANATWDTYFSVGQQYVQKTGKAWFDSAAATWQGMVNQIQYSFVDQSNTVIASTNADVKKSYDQLTAAALTNKESAGLKQWSTDWSAAFKSDKFATMLCPAWIINNIKGNAGADFKGWDIANVFPGGGGDWGGSYLVVPKQSKVADAAAKVAAWVTAAQQQEAVFAAASNYPSSPTAEAASTVASKTEPFLNNAPVGTIFKDRAAAVTVVPYKGAQYFDIETKMADALNRVDVDKSMSPTASWSQWINDVKSLS